MQLPQYIMWFGRLRWDSTFQEIDSKLARSEDAKARIYPILCVRFWCFAHPYFPVFALIVSGIVSGRQTLLMVSLHMRYLTHLADYTPTRKDAGPPSPLASN